MLRYVGPLHCSTSGTPDRYIHVVVRESHFGQIFLSISSNMNNYTQNIRYAHGAGSTQNIRYSQSIRYAHGLGPAHGAGSTQNIRYAHGLGPADGAGSSPQSIEKSDSKWLSLATIS